MERNEEQNARVQLPFMDSTQHLILYAGVRSSKEIYLSIALSSSIKLTI